LTQNLFSMIAGNAQNLILNMNPQGEFVSVRQRNGNKLCDVSKTKSQYLLKAKALGGNAEKTYHAMLAREGRVITASAMLTSLDDTDICELWHRRMGHPSPKALSRLVKEQMATGVSIPNALLNHAQKCRCECCILGKQTHLSFPLSTSITQRPLELVHVDLCGPLNETNAGQRYFMAVMDDFSKYAEVFVMTEKSEAKEKLVDVLIEWENQLEVTVKILRSDGGKEFVSNLVTDYCTSKGIKQQVTPRYTPESNGKIERLNRTLKEKVRCMLIDSHLHVEWWGFCIEYAALLRNCLPVSGKTATPLELFSGKMPDLSLVKVFGCKAYVRLEKADQALTKLGPQNETGIFMGLEPNTKAFRVLIGNEIRVSRHVTFSEEKFRSNGTMDGLMPEEHEEYDSDTNVSDEDYDVIIEPRRVRVHEDPFPPAENREAQLRKPKPAENVCVEEVCNKDAEASLEDPGRNVLTFPPDWDWNVQTLFDFPEAGEAETGKETDRSSDVNAGFSELSLREADEDASAPEGSEESYSARDDSGKANSCQSVMVSNRYPLRSKGPVGEGNVPLLRAVALNVTANVMTIKIPVTYEDALNSIHAQRWQEAMDDEISSIVSKGTYEVVPRPTDRKVIPVRWVYAVKHDAYGNLERFKGRVVAKGYRQIEGIDYNETYAPVCDQTTRRVLFAIAAEQNLHMHQLDVKTAFLNGELTELTYCEPPPGFAEGKGKVWKLNKALYGLKQAPRAWHECLLKALVAGNFVKSETDAGLFIKRTNTCVVYLITYVDDMIIASTDLSEILSVKKYLGEVFECTDLGEVSHFLGNMVVQRAGSVRVSNPNKVKELLADFNVESPRKVLTPMDPGFVITDKSADTPGGSGKPLESDNRYNELIGSLMYLSNTTRPDISLSVGLLSRFRSNPTTAHWNAGMRVLAYLFHTQEMGLEYHGQSDIVGYADAAFADDKVTLHSTMGYTFLLNGCAVSWSSRKQRHIATSTVEAEYVAFHEATKEAMKLQQLLHEMTGRMGPIIINCDSTGCIANLKNPLSSSYVKHIDARYKSSREMVGDLKIVPQYISTDENVSDVFTKPLANAKFSKFRAGLGMT
jgi:transposase InsO family protein